MKGILPLIAKLIYFTLLHALCHGTLQIMEKKCWSHTLLEVFRVLAGASPTFHPGSLNTNSWGPLFQYSSSFLKRLWIHSSWLSKRIHARDKCDLLPNIIDTHFCIMMCASGGNWFKCCLLRLNELCIQNIVWYVRQCVPYVWAFWYCGHSVEHSGWSFLFQYLRGWMR